jgi:hypothetical protein
MRRIWPANTCQFVYCFKEYWRNLAWLPRIHDGPYFTCLSALATFALQFIFWHGRRRGRFG